MRLKYLVDLIDKSFSRWQFEDEKVEYSDRISKLLDGSLRIASAEMNDTGSWTIVADNRLGQVARKQVALKVHPNQMPIEVSSIQ